ncbi:type II secretion system protein [Polynucleobacter sp. AP-Kolm-20A-A1]|uniref:type II secretion system protein n=1 Tax=Polynucleobacter sp. AP-Kolm-20A-A1 TaxID=2081041 RepID=UPI001BFD4D61|nr:type II secretion system protein [Polynucleobacter sp. AP-Kolm-20A-A1]QWE21456.1 type II secretion system protein [Polynucleobacter sp. AP-Kolm-20A-A1]
MTRMPTITSRQNAQEISGYTLVEALVAMAIFMIGFSGLYFFFNFSHQAVVDTEKRMYLNLMGDRIVQTIASEAQRSPADPLNPFVDPTRYSGSLVSCTIYSDVRKDWCNDLNSTIGFYDPKNTADRRQVDLQKDATGLTINVTLISGNGAISAYLSRKLRQI